MNLLCGLSTPLTRPTFVVHDNTASTWLALDASYQLSYIIAISQLDISHCSYQLC